MRLFFIVFGQAVWPHSGHYRPTEENFQEFMTFLKEKSVDLTDVKVRISTCYYIWCYIFPIKTNCTLFILFDQQTIDGNFFLFSKPFLWWGLCPIISLIGWSWLSNCWLANDQFIHGFKFSSGKNGQIVQMGGDQWIICHPLQDPSQEWNGYPTGWGCSPRIMFVWPSKWFCMKFVYFQRWKMTN